MPDDKKPGARKKLADWLATGADTRAKILAEHGQMPMSVLRLSRGALSKRMFIMQAERPERRGGTDAYVAATSTTATAEAQAVRAEREAMGLGGAGYSRNPSQDRMAASIMAAELVDFFLRYYIQKGQVYVDPFMGQGVQMQVAWLRGVHYRGMDLSAEHVAYIQGTRDRLLRGTPPHGRPTELLALHGDSRFLEGIPDGGGDFCFTSPPYWDIEWYGPEEEQLGTGRTYPEFLDGMEQVARALRRKMKPGGYAVINVNDFRRGGDFYPYHADTIALFQRAGWKPHDTWIIEGLIGGLPKVFAAKSNAGKIAPKVHEYGLVFRA